MSRGTGSDFEMIDGEGILRVRNKTQAKTGKHLNLGCKGKEKLRKRWRKKNKRIRSKRIRRKTKKEKK